MPKPEKPDRLERHSGTGLRGLPKKEGHAGKGGWGKVGSGEDGEAAFDDKDPNYASEEEEPSLPPKVKPTPPIIQEIIQEYLLSGDIEEVVKSLVELNNPGLHPQFVKKALYISMEKQAYERELISKLLSGLYGETIAPLFIAEGLQLALDQLEDAALDSPNATELLSKFLGRAVIDEIIPPVFLKSAEARTPMAKEVLTLANALIAEKHVGERLANIWGPGDLCSVKRLKKEATLLLEEYLTSGDVQEAEKCVRKLNAPSFHFQIVKIAIRLALEKSSEEVNRKILSLFSCFLKIGLFTPGQVESGFRCCFEAIDDIKLDVPLAATYLSKLLETAKNEGSMPQEFDPAACVKKKQ